MGAVSPSVAFTHCASDEPTDEYYKQDALRLLPAIRKYYSALGPKFATQITLAVGTLKIHYETGGLKAEDIRIPSKEAQYLAKQRHMGFMVAACNEDEITTPMGVVNFIPVFTQERVADNIRTTNEYFESDEESRQFLDEVWGEYWRTDQEFNYEWKDMHSDEAVANMIFFGPAAHLVRRVSDTDRRNFGLEGSEKYVVDVTMLSAYPVREEFVEYGAAAVLDSSKRLVGIYVSYMKDMITPGSESWEHAKYMFKATLMTQITLVDHLLVLHLVEANTLSVGVRERLSPDHPLRRLLKPHMYRTDEINLAIGPILLGYERIAHDIFSFGYDSLYEVAFQARAAYEFHPFIEKIERNGMTEEPDHEYPFKDCVPLWNILYEYVGNYLAIYYPEGDDDLRADKEVRGFYNDLSRGLRLNMYDLSIENMVLVLTQLIFAVTGGHEEYGKVLQFLARADHCGTRVREGQTRSDIQAFAGTANLIASLSGLFPRLVDDYSHVFLKDEKNETVMKNFNDFQTKLGQLSDEIDEKNKDRIIPYEIFNPKYLETSVSI